jgi:hypothetical protein
MKKTILSVLSTAFISISSFAQIPNFSFENWTTLGAYEVPNQWGTMNNTTKTFSVYTATKGTPGNPGSSYLKLTSTTVGPAVVNGIAVSGKLDSITMKPISGFPYTAQPASFTGRWQHMIFGNSQGSLKATLTKWNTTSIKRDTIAIAAQGLTGMAMNWANFTINFNYWSSNAPDSCIIELRASGSNPTDQDYLWVDNLAFTGNVTVLKNQNTLINSIVVYPNPGSETITLNLNVKNSSRSLIELIDISGKVILTKDLGIIQGENKQVIDVSTIARGSYFIRVASENGTEIKKIIIE